VTLAAMSRYQDAFKGYSGIGKVAGPSAQEVAGGKQASGNADILRLLGGLAPAAGSLIGAGIGSVVPGAGTAIGGTIGGMAGQLGGSLLSSAADSQTKPYEDADMKRQAKIQALMSVMGGRR